MTKTLLCVIALVAGAGCARSPALVGATHASSPDTVRSLRSQLAGHLVRARGCMTETRMRGANTTGLVHYAFTILPDGRVRDLEVDAWSPDQRMLAACVQSRMANLYFDPAPPREVRIERTFYSCPDEEDGLCRLSLAGANHELLPRILDGLAERDDELESCAAGRGEGEAVLDVRLELGEDGRIMAGRLERSVPGDSALRGCAVGPLLGASVGGEPPAERVELRYSYRLSSRRDEQTAAR